MPAKQTFYTAIDGGFYCTEAVKINSLSVCYNRQNADKSTLLRGR